MLCVLSKAIFDINFINKDLSIEEKLFHTINEIFVKDQLIFLTEIIKSDNRRNECKK